jgi:hypothetical protein
MKKFENEMKNDSQVWLSQMAENPQKTNKRN